MAMVGCGVAGGVVVHTTRARALIIGMLASKTRVDRLDTVLYRLIRDDAIRQSGS